MLLLLLETKQKFQSDSLQTHSRSTARNSQLKSQAIAVEHSIITNSNCYYIYQLERPDSELPVIMDLLRVTKHLDENEKKI